MNKHQTYTKSNHSSLFDMDSMDKDSYDKHEKLTNFDSSYSEDPYNDISSLSPGSKNTSREEKYVS